MSAASQNSLMWVKRSKKSARSAESPLYTSHAPKLHGGCERWTLPPPWVIKPSQTNPICFSKSTPLGWDRCSSRQPRDTGPGQRCPNWAFLVQLNVIEGKTVVCPWLSGSWHLAIGSKDVLAHLEHRSVRLKVGLKRSREPGTFLFLSK